MNRAKCTTATRLHSGTGINTRDDDGDDDQDDDDGDGDNDNDNAEDEFSTRSIGRRSRSEPKPIPTKSRLLTVDSDNYMLRQSPGEQQNFGEAILEATGKTHQTPRIFHGSNSDSLHPLLPKCSLGYAFLDLSPIPGNPHVESVPLPLSDLQPCCLPTRSTPDDNDDNDDLTVSDKTPLFLPKSGQVSCARPLSFHRVVCWCDSLIDGSKTSRDTKFNDDNLDIAILKEARSFGAGGGNSGMNCSSNNGGCGKKGLLGVSTYATNLCCCMCGSLCPTECHACFHLACAEYSGQHLCQWVDKDPSRSGTTYDKEKVNWYATQ